MSICDVNSTFTSDILANSTTLGKSYHILQGALEDLSETKWCIPAGSRDPWSSRAAGFKESTHMDDWLIGSLGCFFVLLNA